MSKTFKIVGEDLSDGYHTFDELYEHRHHLFLCLVRQMPSLKRWLIHDHFEGWDLIAVDLPLIGQISYHLPIRLRPHYRTFAWSSEPYQWDGHTSEDVIKRLEKWNY